MPRSRTAEPRYWSGSTWTGNPSYAWTINFVDGSWDNLNLKKFARWNFRAVRGTLYGE